MTFTTFPINTITNSTVNINVLNVTDPTYGAVGDGVTDDTAAIQAAIAAADAGGIKTIYFPTTSAYYRCDGVLDLSSTWNLCLMGNQDSMRTAKVGSYAPEIVYTGTASKFIDIAHSYGLTIKGLGITVSNASFTGDIINSDFSTGSQVTAQFSIHDCFMGGHSAAAANAQSCLHLASAVTHFIDRCFFRFADYGILGRVASDTTTFSNEVSITRCTFDFLNHYGISPSGSINWNITNNVFEQSNTQEPAGIICPVLGGSGATLGLKIINNGFWDATAGTNAYVDVTGSGVIISDNWFSLDTTNGAIIIRDGGFGNSVTGNRVQGYSGSYFLAFVGAVTSGFTDSGNAVDAAVTYIVSPSNMTYAPQSFSTATVGGARFLGYTTSASTPTTTELPNNKDFCLHFDSGGSAMHLAYNLSGVIKKVALT